VLSWEDQRRRRAYLAKVLRRMDIGSSGVIASPSWTPHVCGVRRREREEPLSMSSLLGYNLRTLSTSADALNRAFNVSFQWTSPILTSLGGRPKTPHQS
jgi:hypothetical protein